MDNLAYLQQISKTPPTAKSSSLQSLMSGKLPKILLGLFVLSVLIIIFGLIFSGNNTDTSEQSLISQANLRCSNLIQTINTYGRKVKSFSLRSSSNSLSAILTETNNNLNTVLSTYYSSEDSSTPEDASSYAEEEASHIEQVNANLQVADLNAILDRNYARQMALEISLLLSLESNLIARTEKPDLKSVLEKSTANLSAIHESFNNFSEVRN
jgi:hypothetical protein